MEAWRTTPKQLLKGAAGPGLQEAPLHHDALAAAPVAAAPGRVPRCAARTPDLLLQDAGPEPADHPGLPEPAGHRALGAVCEVPAQAVPGYTQLLRAGQAPGLCGNPPVLESGPGGRPEGESTETLHHHELVLQEGPGVPDRRLRRLGVPNAGDHGPARPARLRRPRPEPGPKGTG